RASPFPAGGRSPRTCARGLLSIRGPPRTRLSCAGPQARASPATGAAHSAEHPMDLIDLRSDTVTRPTAGMRAAIAAAEVGDDVYGEDPTVIALQDRVAATFGHEAALFTPTGSMANQIAIQLLVPRGEELLCDADAHVVNFETGAAAAIGGVSTRTWPGRGADPDPDEITEM